MGDRKQPTPPPTNQRKPVPPPVPPPKAIPYLTDVTPRLCKDCAHYSYRSDPPGGMFPPMPDRYHCFGNPKRSLIDGEIVVEDAREQRANDDASCCGKSGRWFRRRKPVAPENRILLEGETPCPDCGGGVANLHINCRSGPRISSRPAKRRTFWSWFRW